MIDLPQVVDLVANPQGAQFLRRDVSVMCAWFTVRGLAQEPDELLSALGW